jgi:tetratricopeptide (TPR) repeat protein
VANTHFARAVGAARAGRPDAAAADIEALKAAAAALRSSDAYWAEQTEIQRLAADAWVAFARTQQDQAVTIMQEAAEREERTDKHPITPGPLFPAREQLVEMLLILGRYAEAQREYEAVQTTDPGRFRAVAGAGRAAEAGGIMHTCSMSQHKLSRAWPRLSMLVLSWAVEERVVERPR